MKRRNAKRGERGQGLVEAALSLCMVFGSAVVAILFLLNSGTSVFCKEKLAHISHLAVQYASDHAGDPSVEGETAAYVESLMPQMGLQPNSLKVQVQKISVQQNTGTKVTVTNSFPIFVGGSTPATIAISDSDCIVY